MLHITNKTSLKPWPLLLLLYLLSFYSSVLLSLFLCRPLSFSPCLSCVLRERDSAVPCLTCSMLPFFSVRRGWGKEEAEQENEKTPLHLTITAEDEESSLFSQGSLGFSRKERRRSLFLLPKTSHNNKTKKRKRESTRGKHENPNGTDGRDGQRRKCRDGRGRERGESK